VWGVVHRQGPTEDNKDTIKAKGSFIIDTGLQSKLERKKVYRFHTASKSPRTNAEGRLAIRNHSGDGWAA